MELPLNSQPCQKSPLPTVYQNTLGQRDYGKLLPQPEIRTGLVQALQDPPGGQKQSL